MIEKNANATTAIIRWVSWVVTSAFMIFDGLKVYDAITHLMIAWQANATDTLLKLAMGDPNRDISYPGKVTYIVQLVTVMLLGVLLITGVIGGEVYTRKGLQRGDTFKRIAIILAIEIAVLAVAMLIITFVG